MTQSKVPRRETFSPRLRLRAPGHFRLGHSVTVDQSGVGHFSSSGVIQPGAAARHLSGRPYVRNRDALAPYSSRARNSTMLSFRIGSVMAAASASVQIHRRSVPQALLGRGGLPMLYHL